MAVLLIRCVRSDADRVTSRCARAETDWRLFEAVDADECYLFGTLATDRAAVLIAAIRRTLDSTAPAATIARLDPLLEVSGASAGTPAPFRYIVETDVLPEHEAEFNRWYDREHLPGLAAVPGTVLARRYRDCEAGPRYHACYDVASPATVGSPPWIAVRATPWSEKLRPTFRNTKRTLFRRRPLC